MGVSRGSTGENPLLSCGKVRHGQIARDVRESREGEKGWNSEFVQQQGNVQ